MNYICEQYKDDDEFTRVCCVMNTFEDKDFEASNEVYFTKRYILYCWHKHFPNDAIYRLFELKRGGVLDPI